MCIRDSLSASLCALIYFFLNRNPAFACIGAIFGMGADIDVYKRQVQGNGVLLLARRGVYLSNGVARLGGGLGGLQAGIVACLLYTSRCV